MEIYNVCIGQNHADPLMRAPLKTTAATWAPSLNIIIIIIILLLRQGPKRKPIQHSLDAVVVVYTCYTCILSSLGDENVLSKCSHEIDELEEYNM